MCSRGMNELKNLQYLPRASEPRETMVEDRTRCHADHVGHGFDRFTTAAVGLLKAVNCGEKYVAHSENFVMFDRYMYQYKGFFLVQFRAKFQTFSKRLLLFLAHLSR